MTADEYRAEAEAFERQARMLRKKARELEKTEEKEKTVGQIMINLDNEIWNHFYPDYEDGDNYHPDERNIGLNMYHNIVHILSDKDVDYKTAVSYIENKIKNTEYRREILTAIDWNGILDHVKVKSDFEKALKNVKNGRMLSSKIKWGLNNDDLVTLINLHRDGKYCEKIEELLTDINFHYECGMLRNGRYDELLLEYPSNKDEGKNKDEEELTR